MSLANYTVSIRLYNPQTIVLFDFLAWQKLQTLLNHSVKDLTPTF